MRCVGVGLFALVAISSAAAPDSIAYQPFRVVAVFGTTVRVDIGARTERAGSLRRATVLTPSGAVAASFVRTVRVCERLCGTDERKECHYEVLLRSSAPVHDAVAVLSGAPEIREITAIHQGADEPVNHESRWTAADPIQGFQWTRFPDGVFLTSPQMGRDFYSPSIALAKCAIRHAEPFTILSCPSAKLLYEGSRGIVVSFADYGEAAVEPLLRFQLAGHDAVVIRLGLKAAVTPALLMRGDDGLWRVSFREFDYALLC